jgi:hypothetical protein
MNHVSVADARAGSIPAVDLRAPAAVRSIAFALG